jgi:hypothetical protein
MHDWLQTRSLHACKHYQLNIRQSPAASGQ